MINRLGFERPTALNFARFAAVFAACATAAYPSTTHADELAASDSSLQEIVVTAEKRSERLMDVPMSLTALSGDQLARSGSYRLEDFVGNVPGLAVIDAGALGSQLVIRGMTTGVQAVNIAVATYIDETPYAAQGPFVDSTFAAPTSTPSTCSGSRCCVDLKGHSRAFMIRSHGMGTADLGVWLGLIFGIGGIAGTLLGGYVAARWFARDERAQMRFSGVMPLIVVGNVFLGPTFALLQRMVQDEIRATTLAVVMLLANLIGMGIGPQLVGTFSDLLRPMLGNESLRYAMLTMSLAALWAAYEFWLISATIEEDLLAVADAADGETISGKKRPRV